MFIANKESTFYIKSVEMVPCNVAHRKNVDLLVTGHFKDDFHNLFMSLGVPVFVVGDFNCLDINCQISSATSKFSSLLCHLIDL